MVTAAIYLPETLSRGDEHAQDCLTHIGQRGYSFTGQFLRDVTALEHCLKERTAEVVVIGHHKHRPFDLEAREARVLAAVISLDLHRSETTTRRIVGQRRRGDGECVPIRTAHQLIADAVRRWTSEFAGQAPFE